MKYLLIPSRHIIYSKEQYQNLQKHLTENAYDWVIFAISSSNLNNCKYSPITLTHRIMMIDNLVFNLKKDTNFKHKIVCIPHYSHTGEFAERIIKLINLELELKVDKENTEVYALGEYMGKSFEDVGYKTYIKPSIDHVTLFKKMYEENDENFFHENLSTSSTEVLENQGEILTQAKKIWLDKVLQEKGSITENRDYNTYAYQMSNKEMIEVKYNDIKEFIVEGKIADEGCADATLFLPISRDFPDSDLLGIDISNDFIARANENIRRGIYGKSFVTILQANLMHKIFEDNTINTVICNSTMHEIWSYNNKLESVNEYLKLKYSQLKDGGRIIIRDVIGPKNKNKIIYFRSLGSEDDQFVKFANDFKHKNENDIFEVVEINNQKYFKTTLKLASEYLLHKDYRDNWDSEMNEEFCHFDTDDWKEIMLNNNFKIVKINSYLSEWIYINRYENKIELLDENKNKINFPDTNVVIVVEK